MFYVSKNPSIGDQQVLKLIEDSLKIVARHYQVALPWGRVSIIANMLT